VLCEQGQRVNGHEFHHTKVDLDGDPTVLAAWAWADGAGRPTTEGLVRGAVHASYLHLHWAGFPSIAARFVSRAAQAA
jgi:cobyrinic acid a,c-diamide synthase